MNELVAQPTINVIYNFVKAGLLHGKRNCPFCDYRMNFTKDHIKVNQFRWVCGQCFYSLELTNSSPVTGYSLNALDFFIRIWSSNKILNITQLKAVTKSGSMSTEF